MKLQDRMRLSVRRRTGQVVLRAELAELGSASQVSYALKALQRDGVLVRLGVGVYAKAHKDSETGAVRPMADFETLAQEVAIKLKMVSAPAASGMTAIGNAPRGSGDALVLDTGRRRVSRKLTLGGCTVVYVNDRTRKHPNPLRVGGRQTMPTTDVAQFVRELARKHQVRHARTPSDQWAETVTRLAGDEVRSGPVQDLLVALKRAGKLSNDDMATLLVN